MNLKKTYTTKDIAKMAKISRGTVDRVIHDRGKVSENSRKKIEEVLKMIDYTPNVLAKTLQSSRTIHIASILPSKELDAFWHESSIGLARASEKYSTYGVRVHNYSFDQKDPNTFKEVVEEVLSSMPDGIVIAPFFYKESVDFFIQCVSKQIPYITFNTNIEDSQALGFVGQDLYQTGEVAGSLLLKTLDRIGEVIIINFDEDVTNAVHIQEKETGFRQFLLSNNYDPDLIYSVKISGNNELESQDQLHDVFTNHSGFVGVFVTTSKAYKVAKCLQYRNTDCVIIGYDMIEENLEYMELGKINYLINQDPKLQAYMASSNMVEHLLFKAEVPRVKLLPINIVIRENYKSFR